MSESGRTPSPEKGPSSPSKPDSVLYDALSGLTDRVDLARAEGVVLTDKEYELLGSLAIWWQTEGRFATFVRGSSSLSAPASTSSTETP